MKRLLSILILAAGHAVAGETVELSAASPRDQTITGTLHITRLDAETTMRGVLAETQATLTLTVEADPAQKMEGRLVFPLPPGCMVTGAALDIGDIMRPASVTFKETAKKAYDSVVSRMLDPTLIQLLPDGRVSVQVFPFTGGVERKLRLEFAQPVLPGTNWEFPLQFAEPVTAHMKGDAPSQSSNGRRIGFRGGDEWTVPVRAGSPKAVWAHSDGNGRWIFQTYLPPGEPAKPPQHLLVLADVSLLQAGRDAAAEQAFLERLFQKMQSGRVTLATFSTALHGQAEYAVQEGKCPEVLAALAAVSYDGAPRPGAVDVSGIPADLTLLLSTLAAPMGGGHAPRLPNAPVWVLDSVSPAPSARAVLLANDTGGQALDPRKPQEIQFRHRAAMTTENLTAINFHVLPAGGWLVTGELSAEDGSLIFGGKKLIIPRGRDTASGAIAAHQQARRNFLRLAAESAGLLREEMKSSPAAAPFLTKTTALIVLEQQGDYERFGIPLPPDLAQLASKTEDVNDKQKRETLTAFEQALRRPAVERGAAAEWHRRVRSEPKRAALGDSLENDTRFRYHRRAVEESSNFLNWIQKDPSWLEWKASALPAQEQLSDLAARYRTTISPLELIRQAHEIHGTRIETTLMMAEYLGSLTAGLMSGGTPTVDPFHLTEWLRRGGSDPSDPFSGTGAGFSDNSFLSRTSDAPWGPGEPVVVPFLTNSGPVPASTPEPAGSSFPVTPTTPSSRRFDPPQIPQTFGGGGSLFGGGPFAWNGSSFPVTPGGPRFRGSPPVSGPAGLDYYHPGSATGDWSRKAGEALTMSSTEIVFRATALHRAGRQPEALRTLSRLAIPGKDDHTRLRLLAWVLQEWGEPALAVEVLAHARRMFGSSDTTLRDLGLALLVAGRKDEALTQLRRAGHPVALRDTAALNGSLSVALRIVVECAAANADADLEIEGPDYELCSWRNPLPAFGGALSFDGAGEAPEDFVLPELPAIPVKVRVQLHGERPVPVRVTIVEHWGRPEEKVRIIVMPQCRPGRNVIAEQ